MGSACWRCGEWHHRIGFFCDTCDEGHTESHEWTDERIEAHIDSVSTPASKGFPGMPEPTSVSLAKALQSERAARRAADEENERLKKELDWQNMPNKNPAGRGGYEFYINEEWTILQAAAIDTDPGFVATLQKRRFDPDDDRIRVRLVLDDDALLEDAKRADVAEARIKAWKIRSSA